MRRPAPIPPSLRRTGFTVEEARAVGVGRSRLRVTDLEAPFYGVRTTRPLSSSIQTRAAALAARMTPDQYFSHATAAILLDLRMPEGFVDSTLHVTSVRPHRGTRLTGVVGHDSAGARLELVDGLRVLNPIDTWLQLAPRFSVDDLVVTGDGLVRRRRPLATMRQLGDAVSRERRRGVGKLRAALALIRPGTDSARETSLRLFVVRSGFPEPEVNGVILNRYGAKIAHGDLVFRQNRTILEYEGRHHGEDARQFSIDIARLDELMDEDWRVIRVDKALLAQQAVLRGKIDRALRRGGWNGVSI